MSQIVLGKASGRKVTLDLDRLLRTRLLIQSNSGGGKSWLLRRLAEQLFGRIPVLLVDPEGEFATLRERYGYILVGKGGETPADPRSAALVAHRLLELRASAVCDLYEMKPSERHRWVRLFLDALIDAPKKLWRPTIVVVDEAHQFAPEKGHGESETSESMVGLATRGRKRGFAAVFATQRLGKLRKDVAAELLNVLIGQTFIDIDRKRAADALGVPAKEERAFFDQVKVLEPGTFWGLGRAIATERVLLEVGPVETTHPEPGSARHAAAPPPAPRKVKNLLPRLQDLPKEAEQEAQDRASLRAEVSRLKRELVAAQRAQLAPVSPPKPLPAPKVEVRKVPALKQRELRQVEAIVKGLAAIADRLKIAGVAWSHEGERLVQALRGAQEISAWRPQERVALPAPRPAPPLARATGYPTLREVPRRAVGQPRASGDGGVSLRAGERRMLETLARGHPAKRTRAQFGTLSGFTPSGGTFSAYFGTLKRHGLIVEERDGSVAITEEGLATAGVVPSAPQTTEEILDTWRRALRAGERKMLDVLVAAHPKGISREDLGNQTGFTASGGTFSAYLGTLRRNGLAEVGGDEVVASETLFG